MNAKKQKTNDENKSMTTKNARMGPLVGLVSLSKQKQH